MNGQAAARLLIVEDNADNRDVLGRRLKRLGYTEISYAEDGVLAHEMLAKQPFDLVLLDVMMPRMGGVELLGLMHAEGRLEDTPVIMISAATELDTVVRCIELGAEDYLPKPFNPVLLRARLASVLEKRTLRAAVRAQLAALEYDLAQARAQQLSMVPTEFPGAAAEDRVTVHAEMHPARQVGGDLYDCFEITPRVLCVAVGDVAGKGMPAALFMARARSLIRATALQIAELTGRVAPPEQLAMLVNQELCRNNPSCMFITLFLGLLDVQERELRFINAGHLLPYHVPADGAEVAPIVCRPALPLGMMDTTRYHVATACLSPGDALVSITDGLPEMCDPSGAFYTLDRVRADIAELRDTAPRTMVHELCARVLRFVDTAEQADDVTALALRMK